MWLYVNSFCLCVCVGGYLSGRDYVMEARKLSANLYGIYHCCVYSEKLLMMDRGTV
jgi:hypothetical protein